MLPWNDTSPESEQIRFIKRWHEGRVTFAQVCSQFGISRKTGYKRLRRFESNGWDGVGDYSSAPHRRPNKTPQAISERLISERHRYPTWGPKKLVARLRAEEPEVAWPAPSTVGGILDREGLVRRRRRRRHTAPWSTPLQLRTSPTTSGVSTSRGGSTQETECGSTL